MKRINCVGDPFEIGLQHGTAARTEIGRSLEFYEDLFNKNSGKSWFEVRDIAAQFDPMLREDWPEYFEEMRGEYACDDSLFCGFSWSIRILQIITCSPFSYITPIGF